jgi:hypothetical protein
MSTADIGQVISGQGSTPAGNAQPTAQPRPTAS